MTKLYLIIVEAPIVIKGKLIPTKLWAFISGAGIEKLPGDLLLGLKVIKIEILSTSFIDFHNEQ